jgi:hypothetical protein
MERLTIKTSMGWQLKGNIGVHGDVRLYNDAMDRLAAYEDSSLTPEHVAELKNEMSELEAMLQIYRGFKGSRLNQIMDTELDGRLAIHPCKIGDIEATTVDRERRCPSCHLTTKPSDGR